MNQQLRVRRNARSDWIKCILYIWQICSIAPRIPPDPQLLIHGSARTLRDARSPVYPSIHPSIRRFMSSVHTYNHDVVRFADHLLLICFHTYIHFYIPTCLHARTHTCMYAFMHACWSHARLRITFGSDNPKSAANSHHSSTIIYGQKLNSVGVVVLNVSFDRFLVINQ